MGKPDFVIFIDRQHAGKPGASSWRDRGAHVDTDRDGRVEVDEAEAMHTARLGVELEVALLELAQEHGLDVAVFVLSDGTYPARHARVNTYANGFVGVPAGYVALHYNAFRTPEPTTGAVFSDGRSSASRGPALARAIAEELDDVWRPVMPYKCHTHAASGGDWTKNAFATIRGVSRPVSVCLEPGFMTSPAHKPMFTAEGHIRTARAVARGLFRFFSGDVSRP